MRSSRRAAVIAREALQKGQLSKWRHARLQQQHDSEEKFAGERSDAALLRIRHAVHPDEAAMLKKQKYEMPS